MKFCEVSYGDFVVWREEELVVERICSDEECIMSALNKCTNLCMAYYLRSLGNGIQGYLHRFWQVSYPDLFHYQRTHCKRTLQENCFYPLQWIMKIQSSVSSQSGRTVESGKMIAYDNENCEFTWFHISCLRISKIPKRKWFCPECTPKLM